MNLISKIKPIHPFAARMAPEIAFDALTGLDKNAVILDPMSGSGTVLKTVSELGYRALGFDIDPLSILMSTAWTSNVDVKTFFIQVEDILEIAKKTDPANIYLPWIDEDDSTKNFIKFWFAQTQINDLRKLAYALKEREDEYSSLLKIGLSKLIIKKSKGASLAADVSHSRPHRVTTTNNFDVLVQYKKTCQQIGKMLKSESSTGQVRVSLGDARNLKELDNNSVDSIITSPPYLNALDYMRGHKLALVWLGYKIGELSSIRGGSIGAEKAPDRANDLEIAKRLTSRLVDIENLPANKINMIYRYALDMHDVIKESSRVLKRECNATFVVGNSCIKGVYIENTKIIEEAGKIFGLQLINEKNREIPQSKRYLPPPKGEPSGLNKRMRTEAIMTFLKN